MRRFASVLAFLAACGAAREAGAEPQMSAGLTSGLALTDLRLGGARPAFHLGGRFDVLLLRERAGAMALGPFVEVLTAAFDTFESGGGLEWLLPAGDTAFIVSGGAFARTSRFGWEPGISGTLFWGSRSFNYHSAYSIGAGLFAQGRFGLGDGKQGDVIFGAQVDLEYFALPFLFVYGALSH